MNTKITTGKVSSADDGAKAMRVEAELAETDGSVYPEPLDPVVMSGWCWPPEPADTILAFVPDGEEGTEFADEVKWAGTVHDQENPVAEEFHENYPKARGFKTAAGHLFVVDDKDKWISIKTPAGHEILLDEKQDKVSVRYKDTDVITINASGIFFGTESASEPMVLGDLWKAMMDTILNALAVHIHPTGVGPSGPPDNAATYTGEAAKTADTISDFIKGQKAKP